MLQCLCMRVFFSLFSVLFTHHIPLPFPCSLYLSSSCCSLRHYHCWTSTFPSVSFHLNCILPLFSPRPPSIIVYASFIVRYPLHHSLSPSPGCPIHTPYGTTLPVSLMLAITPLPSLPFLATSQAHTRPSAPSRPTRQFHFPSSPLFVTDDLTGPSSRPTHSPFYDALYGGGGRRLGR